jgi:hypothetical protein
MPFALLQIVCLPMITLGAKFTLSGQKPLNPPLQI